MIMFYRTIHRYFRTKRIYKEELDILINIVLEYFFVLVNWLLKFLLKNIYYVRADVFLFANLVLKNETYQYDID